MKTLLGKEKNSEEEKLAFFLCCGKSWFRQACVLNNSVGLSGFEQLSSDATLVQLVNVLPRPRVRLRVVDTWLLPNSEEDRQHPTLPVSWAKCDLAIVAVT